MKKLFSVMLVALLAFALVGCGASDEEKIVGDWTCEVDMTEVFGDALEENDMADLDLGEVRFNMNMSFDEEGNYTMTVDKDSFLASMEGVSDALYGYLEDNLVSDLTSLATGYGMSYEDMLSTFGCTDLDDFLITYMGTSLDSMMDEVMQSLVSDDAIANMGSEGTYRLEEGLLYMTTDGEERADGYAFDGNNTLTLTLDEAAELPVGIEAMYPMTLTRVK